MIRSSVLVGRKRRPVSLQRSFGASISAPVGGWNARDSVADMPETDAFALENWFPRTSDVIVRGGSAIHASGLNGEVETVMTYTSGSTSKFFAAAGPEIHDVSSPGPVGAAVVNGMNSARWQHVNFGNSAGEFLYIVNGSDNPRYYDGATWTVPTITGSGLTKSNLVHIMEFKNRLIFLEKNKMGFWYFPLATISGSISYFDLSGVARMGGFVEALGTWTRDGGSGIDDYAIFITSEGEVIIYKGTDPGDADFWALVGVYRIGSPLGRRCLIKLASDLIVMTVDGFAPLANLMTSDRSSDRLMVSDKISGAVKTAVGRYKDNFGWQPFQYPFGDMLIFNIPVSENISQEQYVSNLTTGAWCKFSGLKANCWALFEDMAYFGDNDGNVQLFDTGNDDNNNDILANAQTAFTYLKRHGQLKKFNMARPILASDGVPHVAINSLVDFEEGVLTSGSSFVATSGSPWDTSPWDTSDWSGKEKIYRNWQDISGVGYAVALQIYIAIRGGSLHWHSTDIIWEPAGLV